ncbi:MAG: Mut7-C ubiquitin/RNAse domain-containing protein [Desulfobulbaceae bacterium]|nr:Mut7-C ubiquitin/RNAse domain-containing protein [Desulfobulbaceae bacterium]
MITLQFQGNLVELLPKKFQRLDCVRVELSRKSSVKDVIESYGIPHPEVEKILADGRDVDFEFAICGNEKIDVFPISADSDFSKTSLLRNESIAEPRFLIDVNVGKLASKLRFLGFDTFFDPNLGDETLAAISSCQRRILLTKDRNLLKRKIVTFGHLVRAGKPKDQLLEVVRLFRLKEKINPFTRCLQCNGLLAAVTKREILHLLEPLTKKYFDVFYQCPCCRKIYWPGSHRDRMEIELQTILGREENQEQENDD